MLIDSFARFRGMLALLASGRENDARAQLDALQTRAPDAPLARLGAELWDQYSMTGQLQSACRAVQPRLASQGGEAFSALNQLGVQVDAASVCAAP
jgi:hypothetical protein